MRCPLCLNGTKVIDSRLTLANQVRRRRSCKSCLYRFTTSEGTSQNGNRTTQYPTNLEEIREMLTASLEAVNEALASVTQEDDPTTGRPADAES